MLKEKKLCLGPVVLALGLALTVPPSFGTVLDPVSTRDLVTDAELVFEGTVLDVTYRNSETDSQGHAGLPHTFVTFAVDRTLKGSSEAGNLITLRFQGGADGAGNALMIPGIPFFDVGDRDVLFVRANGKDACPLVGWNQGRFRLIGDKVFSDDGREVWLTADGELAFGRAHDVFEARVHRIGDVEIELVSEGEEPQAPTQPRAGARRLDAQGFASAVVQLLGTRFKGWDLTALSPATSVSPLDAFSVEAYTAGPPPLDPEDR